MSKDIPTCLSISCIIGLFQGGIKAVIWTDVFQIVVMFSGFVAIYIHGTVLVGGPAAVLEIANNGSRLNFDEYVRTTSFVKVCSFVLR